MHTFNLKARELFTCSYKIVTGNMEGTDVVMIDDDSRESIVLGGPPQGRSAHPPAHEEQTAVMPQVVVVLPCVFVHVRVLFRVRAVLDWHPR